MQLFCFFSVTIIFLISFRYAESLQCWGFSTLEFEGTIQKTDKVKTNCDGNYCLTLSEQGDNFNVFNGTCPDPDVPLMNCQKNGVGCQKTKIGETYIKVCCCDSDLCNTSSHQLLYLLISATTFYYLILY